LLVEVSPVPAGIARTRDRTLILANKALAELMGEPLDDLLGACVERFHAREEEFQEIARQIRSKHEVRDFPTTLKRADGGEVRVAAQGRTFSLDGELVFLCGFADLSELDRTVQALKESEEKYRLIVETSSQGIWAIGAEGKTTYANQRMADMLGCTREELMASSVYDFADEEGRAQAGKNLERRSSGIAEMHEFKFIRKDGTPVWTELATAPYFAEDGTFTGGVAMIQDISERKRVEQEREALAVRLRHTEKLEALGTLVSGIAHDFNNLLVPIVGHTEFLLRRAGRDSPEREQLESIQEAAHRASDVVREFLSFARKSPQEIQPISLERFFENSQRLLRAALPSSIAQDWQISPGIGALRGNEGELHQIFLNLGSNAADAMHGRGTIQISAESVDIGEESAAELEVDPGVFLVVRVRDTGEGIDPEDYPRIFDPYFTTKDVGKGTGLGLPTVHGIVRRHGGAIKVESELGKGTEFSIYLPRIDEERKSTQPPVEEPSAAANGTAPRVLIVDDEPAALRVLGMLLREEGYSVVEFESPKPALEAFRHEPKLFDLVITDQTMPEMSGEELAVKIHELNRDVPILLCSGWLIGDGEAGGVPQGVSEIIMKPYMPDEILERVRVALETASSTAFA
jgi:PAS domain S-box-containing protein